MMYILILHIINNTFIMFSIKYDIILNLIIATNLRLDNGIYLIHSVSHSTNSSLAIAVYQAIKYFL